MTPRAFLLALLQAFGCSVPVRTLIQAGEVFDFDENRVRVALHRLRTKGLVDSEERGSYRIGREAEAIQSQVVSWRRQLDRLMPWSGDWIGAHTAPLPRADKTVARRRDQALDMLGFRELQSGLSIRPDNLVGSIDKARGRLRHLGLEPEAPVFRLSELGDADALARSLWDGDALDERYRAHTRRLTRLTLEVRSMPLAEAAKASFEAGGDAVRDIVMDPLLPAPIVDPALREAFVQTMVAFDDVGRDLWSRVLDSDLPLRQSPTIEPSLL